MLVLAYPKKHGSSECLCHLVKRLINRHVRERFGEVRLALLRAHREYAYVFNRWKIITKPLRRSFYTCTIFDSIDRERFIKLLVGRKFHYTYFYIQNIRGDTVKLNRYNSSSPFENSSLGKYILN